MGWDRSLHDGVRPVMTSRKSAGVSGSISLINLNGPMRLTRSQGEDTNDTIAWNDLFLADGNVGVF